MLRILGLLFGVNRGLISFDRDFYFCPRLQFYFFSILIFQRIIYSNLFVKMVRPFNGDLCFLWNNWRDRRYDLFDDTWECNRRLVGFIILSAIIAHHTSYSLTPGHSTASSGLPILCSSSS